MEQRTLKAAYKFYCDKNLDGAHEAMLDTSATLEIFVEQLDKYKDVTFEDSHGGVVGPVPQEMDELHEFCQRSQNVDIGWKISL